MLAEGVGLMALLLVTPTNSQGPDRAPQQPTTPTAQTLNPPLSQH